MSAEFIFPPPPFPSVAIAQDARRFPVRRIFCIALNYAAHAREMGKDPAEGADAEPPAFFSKPADAVVESGATIPYPTLTHNLHHEIELVAALGKGGADIPAERALDCVFGYAAGIDLTRRDLQAAARGAGRPWDMSKGFDHSAPIGAISPVAAIGHPTRGRIALCVNGALRQAGDLGDLIWSVPDIIAALSRNVTLAPGDLIFTGTPSGVGPLLPGDIVDGEVEHVGSVAVSIGK
ncbi:fumarylacetoacetate hydrolase family protein [Methylocystis sp. SC2]|uniref:fumarylacetoacetate hydrolase family protein n=1 Tax=Methylocystis sp. (strain SC2) TaxID=187303 RepID=UPI00027AF4D9|nr:fumarylacetoacetate hydrolase family protein [Methylocystis sp. SC2]CCJ07866.1 Fumarylacetoacetate (FAA) hydrolase [Methylocystis sp. SC2]